MNLTPTLLKLHDILRLLIGRRPDIDTLLGEAHIDATIIVDDPTPSNYWLHVLDYAYKNEQVKAVIQVARKRYPSNQPLLDVEQLWQAEQAAPPLPDATDIGRIRKDQYEQLHALLCSAYRTKANFELFVKTRLGEEPENIAPVAGLENRFLVLIERYKNQPEVLVRAAMGDPMHNANAPFRIGLQDILDNLERQIRSMQHANPLQACFLDQGRPFVNRYKFRHHIQDLNSEKGKRFLVVNGPPGFGKTHSQYYVEAVAPHYNFKYCFIELEQETPSKYYPDSMARRIDRDLTLLNTEPMPDKLVVGDRWATELCDWLVAKMKLENNRCWIILDGFGNANLPDETRQLVIKLIDAVNKRLPKVRLVLLDYPITLPRELRPFVHVEDLQEVNQEELQTYFQMVFLHRQVEFDDQLIQDIAVKILDDLPANQEDRMLEVMLRIIDTVKLLFPED